MINKYQTGGSFLDSMSKQASDRYEEFSNSPWGTVYDVVNAGLYAAAPFTGGATLVPAIGMSVVQGLAGANNMYQKGANLNNTLDVVGGLVAAPGKAVAKPIMKTVGKSTKYVKRMPLVTKRGKGILATKPLWKQAVTNKKYLPYATYSYTNLGSNIGQIGNDLKDNYKTYVVPYKELNKRISELTKREYDKKK